jgi:hypothetical protein
MAKFNFLLKIKLPVNFSKIYFSKNFSPDNPKTNSKSPDSSPLTPKNLTKFIFQSKIKFTASQMGKNNLIFLNLTKPNLDNKTILLNRDNSKTFWNIDFPSRTPFFSFLFSDELEKIKPATPEIFTFLNFSQTTEDLGSSPKYPSRQLLGPPSSGCWLIDKDLGSLPKNPSRLLSGPPSSGCWVNDNNCLNTSPPVHTDTLAWTPSMTAPIFFPLAPPKIRTPLYINNTTKELGSSPKKPSRLLSVPPSPGCGVNDSNSLTTHHRPLNRLLKTMNIHPHSVRLMSNRTFKARRTKLPKLNNLDHRFLRILTAFHTPEEELSLDNTSDYSDSDDDNYNLCFGNDLSGPPSSPRPSSLLPRPSLEGLLQWQTEHNALLPVTLLSPSGTLIHISPLVPPTPPLWGRLAFDAPPTNTNREPSSISSSGLSSQSSLDSPADFSNSVADEVPSSSSIDYTWDSYSIPSCDLDCPEAAGCSCDSSSNPSAILSADPRPDTEAMEASLKTSSDRQLDTEAMEASLKTSSDRQLDTEAMEASSKTSSDRQHDWIDLLSPGLSTTPTKLPTRQPFIHSSHSGRTWTTRDATWLKSPRSRSKLRRRISDPPLSPFPEFSLSKNVKPRPRYMPLSPRHPLDIFKTPINTSLHWPHPKNNWIPHSAARKRFEKMRKPRPSSTLKTINRIVDGTTTPSPSCPNNRLGKKLKNNLDNKKLNFFMTTFDFTPMIFPTTPNIFYWEAIAG